MNDGTVRMMLCRVGPTTCALDLAHVVEILRPLPIQTLAGMPEFVLGVSILRGAPVPIVDARVLLGTNAAAPPSRVVSLRVEERSVGIAVDDVLGFRTTPPGHTLPPLLRAARTEVVETLGRLDSGLLLVLRAARLIPAPEAAG